MRRRKKRNRKKCQRRNRVPLVKVSQVTEKQLPEPED